MGAEVLPIHTAPPSCADAVEAHLTAAGIALSSRRVYRVSLMTWARSALGNQAPIGRDRPGGGPRRSRWPCSTTQRQPACWPVVVIRLTPPMGCLRRRAPHARGDGPSATPKGCYHGRGVRIYCGEARGG